MLKKQKIVNKGRNPQNKKKFFLLSRLILHYKQDILSRLYIAVSS